MSRWMDDIVGLNVLKVWLFCGILKVGGVCTDLCFYLNLEKMVFRINVFFKYVLDRLVVIVFSCYWKIWNLFIGYIVGVYIVYVFIWCF